jgi:hypothetical protein
MFHQKLSNVGIYLYLALSERPQEAAAWVDLVQYLQKNWNKLTNEEIFLQEEKKKLEFESDWPWDKGRVETIWQSITEPSRNCTCLYECANVESGQGRKKSSMFA